MKSTHSIIFEFFLPIQQILYKTIWPQHNSLLRRTQGIIKKKKWRVRRPLKNRTSSTTLTHGSLSPYVEATPSPLNPDPPITPREHPFTSRSSVTLHSTRSPSPLWFVLITFNYLHSGEWTTFLRYNNYIDFLDDNNSFLYFFLFFLLFFLFHSSTVLVMPSIVVLYKISGRTISFVEVGSFI